MEHMRNFSECCCRSRIQSTTHCINEARKENAYHYMTVTLHEHDKI